MSKLHIKKGDNVIVIAGNSKSNKPRRVLAVYPNEQRALVEGVNLVSKSTKPTSKSPNGGIIKKEASVHISNLNVADPKTGKPTRIGRKLNAEGKLVRYSKKTGEEIK
jgi:large subunit ribosomal protein L24